MLMPQYTILFSEWTCTMCFCLFCCVRLGILLVRAYCVGFRVWKDCRSGQEPTSEYLTRLFICLPSTCSDSSFQVASCFWSPWFLVAHSAPQKFQGSGNSTVRWCFSGLADVFKIISTAYPETLSKMIIVNPPAGNLGRIPLTSFQDYWIAAFSFYSAYTVVYNVDKFMRSHFVIGEITQLVLFGSISMTPYTLLYSCSSVTFGSAKDSICCGWQCSRCWTIESNRTWAEKQPVVSSQGVLGEAEVALSICAVDLLICRFDG